MAKRTGLTQRMINQLVAEGTRAVLRDSEISGLEVRATPSGAKSFSLMYRTATGKRKRFTIGDTETFTLAQARREAAELKLRIRRGEDPQADKAEARRHLTFEEYLDGPYLADLQRRTAEGKLRGDPAKKVAALKSTFKTLLEKYLTELTEWDFVRWRERRTKEAKKHKAGKPTQATLNRLQAYAKAALNVAVRKHLVPDNPLRHLRPDLSQENMRERYLSPEEEARLFEALDAREEAQRAQRDAQNAARRLRGWKTFPDLRALPYVDYLKPLVILALNTALRRSELFLLEWRDVDLERGTLTVRRESAKSKKARRVPLNQAARDMLRTWRGQCSESPYVFEAPEGGHLSNIYRPWNAILREAELRDFKFHDLRHSAASRMVQRGASLYTVQKLLGHSVLTMTARYSHLADEQLADAVGLLDVEAGNVIVFPVAAEDRAKP